MIRGESGTGSIKRISMRDVPGKDMYCDLEAYREIGLRLKGEDSVPFGIHFIDTGNYHYLTRIITSYINEKYELVLIDHHTDMQEPAFDGILSCGSWALEALEEDANLARLSVYGPPSVSIEAGRDIEVSLYGKKVLGKAYEKSTCSIDTPLYLSVDKDILSTNECVTNWDQGDMSLSELEDLIKKVVGTRRIIGADICGGLSGSDPKWTEEIMNLNIKSDMSLYKVIVNLMNR